MKPVSLLVAVLLFGIYAFSETPQKESADANFATRREIELVVAQSERAIEGYKKSIEMEKMISANKQNPVDVRTDTEALEEGQKLISMLKKNPESFHVLGGLVLLSTLDDMSRNAALCSSSGYAQIVTAMAEKADSAVGYQMLAVIQSCIGASQELYTVSESVQALLVRGIKAQQNLNGKMMQTIDNCTSILKKQKQ
jgi:hypothetical protein